VSKRGKKTPLDDMPVYDLAYEWYMKAYHILRFSRRESGYIPLSEILLYTSHFELIGAKHEFITIIQGLDFSEREFFDKRDNSKKDQEKPQVNKRIQNGRL